VSELRRYPLCWPPGWKRTRERTRAAFGRTTTRVDASQNRSVYAGKEQLSVMNGAERVIGELERLGVGADDVVISTNVPVRLDGLPRSDRAEPADPGVAVYWELRGKRQCMAIDRYDRVADNLAAVAATLEALRAIERHGGGAILERAFQGFAQLPASVVTQRPWRDVLEFGAAPASAESVQERFRELARRRHPDVGGTAEQFQELTAARDAALQEIGQ